MTDVDPKDPRAPEPSVSIAGQRRRLCAVMFTDIKGFTAIMESDEETAIGLVKAQREIIRRQIALHEGEERETIGDAFLVIFDSAVNAVQCAIAIQRDIWEYNQTREKEKQVWVRIGLHLGDIVIEEGSVYGEGVNLAARVQPLAEPGGICVTRQLYDQVKHHLEIKIAHMGVRELKNVSDVPDIYRIRLSTTAPHEPLTIRQQVAEVAYTPLRKALLVAAILLVIAADLYWTFVFPHVFYARDVAFLHHAPVARHEISAREAKTAHRYYRITRSGQKVIRLELVEKPDYLPADAQEGWEFGFAKRPKHDWPIREYLYEGGHLAQERTFDRFGVLQHNLVFDEQGHVSTVHDPVGFVKTFENQIAGYGYELDVKGRLVRLENRNAFGIPRNDSVGVASYRYSYGDDDLPIEISTFDAHGNAVENKEGVHRVTRQMNGDGLVAKETFFDRYGAVHESTGGVAVTERQFDAKGRPVHETYFDRAGQPSVDRQGACGRRFVYDNDGHTVEITTLSCAGSPRATRAGFATLRYQYDGDRAIREAFFDETGAPTADSRGIAATAIAYDSNGRITEVDFFGPDGTPIAGDEQAARIHYASDENGRPASRRYLSADGKPAIGRNGFSEMRVRWSDRGEPVEWAYFDTEGNLVNRREGYAVVRNEHDQFGNLVSRSYFDKGLEPAIGKDGSCHRLQMKYDENGDLQETRCFDGKGALTPGFKSCAIGRIEHDSFGNLTRYECYADEGVLIDLPNLPSILTAKYDKRGYLAEVRAFDAAKQPADRYQGAAIWRRTSDDFGNQREIATYDRNGKLIENPKFKAAIFRREFDNRGNELSLRAFDTEEHPTIGIWGYAEVRSQYDGRSRKTSEAYFDEKGEPTANWQGVHEYRTSYDDSGRTARIEHLDVDGKPVDDVVGVALTRFTYDRWGQPARTDFFDAAGNPAHNRKTGAASELFTNDDRGNVVEIRNLDAQGQPCREPGCVADTVQEFDAKGQMVKQLFRDADGQPTTDKEGASGFAVRYDVQGRAAEKHVLGPDGADATDAAGVHAYRIAYRPDLDEAVWYSTFLDEDEQPVRSRAGADLRVILYDPSYRERAKARVDATLAGGIVEEKCLDEAGNVTEKKGCVTADGVKAEVAKIKPQIER